MADIENKLMQKWTEGVNDTVTRLRRERLRQFGKWGLQNHDPFYWLGIIGEEYGEIAKGLLEKDMAQAKKEAIECAACCIAFVQNMETGEA